MLRFIARSSLHVTHASNSSINDLSVGFETGMAKVQRSAEGVQGLIGWTVTIGHRRKGQEMPLLGQVVEVRCVHAQTTFRSPPLVRPW